MIIIEYIMMSVKPRNTGRRFICTLFAYVERHMLDIQTTFYLEIAINNTQITHLLGINTTYVCSWYLDCWSVMMSLGSEMTRKSDDKFQTNKVILVSKIYVIMRLLNS